jgi:hypothetical protein
MIVLSPWLSRHIFDGLFGITFGLSCAIASICFFLLSIEKQKILSPEFILAIFILGFTVGAKGPVAAVFLCGYCGLFIYELVFRKNRIQCVTKITLFCATFLLFYLLLFYNTVQNNGITIQIGAIKNAFTNMDVAHNVIIHIFGNSILVNIIYTILAYIIEFSSLIIPTSLMVVYSIRNYRSLISIQVFLLVGVLAGTVATFIFAQNGFSQVFFAFTAIPLAVIGSLQIIKDFLESKNKRRLIRYAICTLSCFYLLFSIFASSRYLFIAINENTLKYTGVDITMRTESQLDGISFSEYTAMLWIKENTKKDDVFLSNRQYLDVVNKNSRYYYYSAFCERRMYLEGYDYIYTSSKYSNYEDLIKYRLSVINGVFHNEEKAVNQAKAEGVSYIIQSTFINSDFRLSQNYGHIVFSNDQTVIYKLK